MEEIKKSDEFGDNIKDEISVIFVDGFFHWLTFFSKDKERLRMALAHMFRPELFYVAVLDGKPVGIAACTDGKEPPVRLNMKELRHHLGWIKGMIAGIVLRIQKGSGTPFETKRHQFSGLYEI